MRTQIWLDAIRDEKQSGGWLEWEPLTKGFLALVFKPTPAIKYLLLQSGMGGKLHWESFMWIPCWFCSSDGWEIIMLICLELPVKKAWQFFWMHVFLERSHWSQTSCCVRLLCSYQRWFCRSSERFRPRSARTVRIAMSSNNGFVYFEQSHIIYQLRKHTKGKNISEGTAKAELWYHQHKIKTKISSVFSLSNRWNVRNALFFCLSICMKSLIWTCIVSFNLLMRISWWIMHFTKYYQTLMLINRTEEWI